MTLARTSTLHPKPLPTGPPPPLPQQSDVTGPLIFRTGKSIKRAFTTRRSSPQSAERRKRTVSARIDMIGNPVLHQDEEGKTLKSLAKMGVHLGNDLGTGTAVGATVTSSETAPPLRKSITIQRKPVPRHSAKPVEPVIVEETIIEEPEPEPVSEDEIKLTNVTNKRDKRRGFVFNGINTDSDLDTLRPAPHIMDWKLHDLLEEDEEEDENEDDEDEDDMSGQESPVSSSCAHEADPIDSIRWSFLAPSSRIKQDILSLKMEGKKINEKTVVDERQVDEVGADKREANDEEEFSDDGSEGEDVKEMRRELESVEKLLGSITASFAKGSNQDNMAPTRNDEDLQTSKSGSGSHPEYDEESPTLGHCQTLNIIKSTEATLNTSSKPVDTIESMEKAISKTEDMIIKIKASTGYGQKTGPKPEPLNKPGLTGIQQYINTNQGPEESLRAVLSSPTSRKSFSEFLDTANNNNRRNSNILQLWLAARAHSAALKYAEQLEEEIKSTYCQEFPDILEPTQTVEVSRIEDKVFNEMLHKEFPEFRRQSQIPQGVQESLDKLVSSTKAAPEVPRTIEPERKERQEKPISVIDKPTTTQEKLPENIQRNQGNNDAGKRDSEIESKKEVMLDSLIKPVPSAKPPPVVKVSGGHQRKVQLSASKHRSFHAVQSFKVDNVEEQIPELPKIPLAYRNSAPSAVNVPSLKPMVAAVEHSGSIETVEATSAAANDKPVLNASQNASNKCLADIVRKEIIDTAELQPKVEKFDLAAMGIVKRNRAALMQRMAALEGAKV